MLKILDGNCSVKNQQNPKPHTHTNLSIATFKQSYKSSQHHKESVTYQTPDVNTTFSTCKAQKAAY